MYHSTTQLGLLLLSLVALRQFTDSAAGSISTVMSIVIGVVATAVLLTHRRRLKQSTADPSARAFSRAMALGGFALLIQIAVAILAQPSPNYTLIAREVVRILSIAILAYASLRLGQSSILRLTWERLFRLTVLVLFVIAATQLAVGASPVDGLGIARVRASYSHANQLGAISVVSFNYAMGMSLVAERNFLMSVVRKWGLTAILSIGLLGLSRSVSAAIGLACSLVVWVVQLHALPRLTPTSSRVLIAPIVGALATVSGIIASRIVSTGSTVTMSAMFALPSWQWRVENWQPLLGLFRSKPLLGFGLTAADKLNPTLIYDMYREHIVAAAPHSDVLRELVDGGLVGIGLLTAAVVVSASGVVAKLRSDLQAHSEKTLFILPLYSALLLMAAVDNILTSTAVLMAVVASVGVNWETHQRDPIRHGPAVRSSLRTR